ncbi:N-glycanase Pngl isoform X2 [Lycorma delicatula]
MLYKSIDSLEENPKEIFLKVTSILMKLVENVVKYPKEPKYRKIRLENQTISTFILPSIGGMECLFDMGFEEGDDSLILPNTVSIDRLKQFQQELIVKRDHVLKKSVERDVAVPSGSSQNQNVKRENNIQNQSVKRESNIKNNSVKKESSGHMEPIVPLGVYSQEKFFREIENRSQNICQYEDKELQLKALSFVPISRIESSVSKQMREIQKSAIKDGSSDLCEASINEILFLKELMKWFKMEFFKWVDAPTCSVCNSATQFHSHSTEEKDLRYTSRVEVYYCKSCNKKELFPRYNDVKFLLETRRGRCGEWGQCFTLFCRAFKWDARFICDNTDHVWTEVYSQFQNRWLHCDPCECVVDKPLLYESGWKKKLDYILAFSCDGVYDVTWRYSANHKEVLSRRNLVPEVALIEHMMRLTEKRRQGLSDKRKKYLSKRHAVELTDFLSPAKEKTGEVFEGRTSGSLAWRLARGEISSVASSSYVWKPSPEEISTKQMVIKYCPCKDQYVNGKGAKLLSNWEKGVFKVKNVFRKEELDWKNVYLCRTEGSTTGTIIWKFDLGSSGMVVDRICINFSITTFKTGSIKLILCGENNCVTVDGGEGFRTDALRGETVITLKAELNGGEGDVAWQHAQLFRKSIESVGEPYPFVFIITLHNRL